jgi:hypothetical protein
MDILSEIFLIELGAFTRTTNSQSIILHVHAHELAAFRPFDKGYGIRRLATPVRVQLPFPGKLFRSYMIYYRS